MMTLYSVSQVPVTHRCIHRITHLKAGEKGMMYKISSNPRALLMTAIRACSLHQHNEQLQSIQIVLLRDKHQGTVAFQLQ